MFQNRSQNRTKLSPAELPQGLDRSVPIPDPPVHPDRIPNPVCPDCN